MATDLLINKTNIRETKFSETKLSKLNKGELRLKLDSFAFTANNITYAATGHSFKYWQFFPTSEDNWGKLPVWGFATITESNHSDIEVGERIYGYYPLATHLTVTVGKVKSRSFQDIAAHRQDLNPLYNTYIRTQNATDFTREHNHLNAILRPMFTTSFMIDDQLVDNDFFGAKDLVLSSASSKTAIGTAFLLNKNCKARPDYKIIGLTSAINKSFVEDLGCYDQVLTYDNLEKLDKTQTAAYIDFAGNGKLRKDLHHHYADNLKHSSMIGLAHWQQAGKREELPGTKPSFFFAPTQVQKRIKDWGAETYQEKLSEAWLSFLAMAANWLDVSEGKGQQAIKEVYDAMQSGKADAKKGYILSF